MAIIIQDVLNQLIEPAGPLDQTVDALESGDASAEVKGIAVAFIATYDVIERAANLGANLLISHEGIFYSHHPNREALKYDPVAREKQRLIDETGMAIFRFHDYYHRYRPDGIMAGLIEQLGWQNRVSEYRPASAIVDIPAATVENVARLIKDKLGIPYVRIVGDMSMACKRIGLLAGYRGGGAMAIPLLGKDDLDLIVAGEGPEWETPEYVRDAVHQGRHKALIILGHASSEEPGMNDLARRLDDRFPDIPVYFLAEKPLFQIF